jgi:hypothetical protein
MPFLVGPIRADGRAAAYVVFRSRARISPIDL